VANIIKLKAYTGVGPYVGENLRTLNLTFYKSTNILYFKVTSMNNKHFVVNFRNDYNIIGTNFYNNLSCLKIPVFKVICTISVLVHEFSWKIWREEKLGRSRNTEIIILKWVLKKQNSKMLSELIRIRTRNRWTRLWIFEFPNKLGFYCPS